MNFFVVAAHLHDAQKFAEFDWNWRRVPGFKGRWLTPDCQTVKYLDKIYNLRGNSNGGGIIYLVEGWRRNRDLRDLAIIAKTMRFELKEYQPGPEETRHVMTHQELAAHYRQGHSMRECAAHFGVSLARVAQLLQKHYPDIVRRTGDTRQNSTGRGSGARRDVGEGV